MQWEHDLDIPGQWECSTLTCGPVAALPGQPLSHHHPGQSTGPASPGNSPASYQLSGFYCLQMSVICGQPECFYVSTEIYCLPSAESILAMSRLYLSESCRPYILRTVEPQRELGDRRTVSQSLWSHMVLSWLGSIYNHCHCQASLRIWKPSRICMNKLICDIIRGQPTIQYIRSGLTISPTEEVG